MSAPPPLRHSRPAPRVRFVRWCRVAGGVLTLCALNVAGQNVIVDRATGPTAPATVISETQALALINRAPLAAALIRDAETLRMARKLERHVAEFVAGAPWKPFHHTLGISGYEVYFNHPDEMFYALSLALPFLEPGTAAQTRTFLAQQLAGWPPYAGAGFENGNGRAREAYDVPASLRVTARGQAGSAFGVYAFWTYVHATGDANAARQHWPAIKQRIGPLLEKDYAFDVMKQNDTHDEAETSVAALEARLREVNAPLQERLAAYQNRIS